MSSPAAPSPSAPGPVVLGRGVVVRAGQDPPPAWRDAPRLRVDDEVVADPGPVADLLHQAWRTRRPVTIELAADNDALREPEVCALPPHALPRDFAFHRERLHVLLWANTYDARAGAPVWWHGVLAQRRGGAAPSDTHDVVLPDGRHAWVDGGPRGPVAGLPDDVALVHRESVALGRLTALGTAAPGDRLAPDQLAAVAHGQGAARVIAPAGSGKTRVLTARLRHLLRDRNVERELITAVAYNTRAAAEMRERTTDLGRVSVRTLHSLALWLCRMEREREVVDERQQRAVLERLVRTGRIPNQDPFQPYLEALSEVRLALRDPSDVEVERGDVDGFAELFDRYREELDRRGWIDFDEQIYRAIELLLTRPDLRQRAQRAGTHLLVDEVQDLTPAFLLLLRLVAGPTQQVFGVGDDDQTIYSYAGASPDHLVDFDRWFPGAHHHALEVNYRCPPGVVDAVTRLLSHNRVRVPKTIRSGVADSTTPARTPAPAPVSATATRAGSGDTAPAIHLVDAGAAAARTVALVRDRLEGGATTGDLAILARVNSALLPVQVALSEAGVAHTAPLDPQVLGRTGIRTALAYLRLGMDLDRMRRDDVLDTLNRPARKVRSAVQPHLQGRQVWTMRDLEGVLDRLDGTQHDRFAGYLGDLHHLAHAVAEGGDTARLLWLVRHRIGLGEAMEALDSSRTRPEGSSHGDDLDALQQLADDHPDPATFRDWLVDRLRIPADPAGVTLSTVHRVKGLEWDHVVVVAANDGLFPHRLSEDVEEERRVFHVAVTRCRRAVDVVADRSRPSPFVAELTAPPAEARPVVPVGDRTPPRVATPRRTADGGTVAEPGLRIGLAGGLTGDVVALDGEVAIVRLDPLAGTAAAAGGDGTAPGDAVVTRVPFGRPVTIDGQPTRLTAAPRTTRVAAAGGGRLLDVGGLDEPEDPELFEVLRVWRARTAAASKLPAFVVFHDRTLQAIAARKPTSVRELGAIPGIGPAKLERYADELLELVEDAIR